MGTERVGARTNSPRVRLGVSSFRSYPEDMSERVVIQLITCNGRPTAKGTRGTAQAIPEFLAAGDEIEDVLARLASAPLLLPRGFTAQRAA